MSETVTGGAALAWRLLATLEGGSLVLATTALLAYTARSRSRSARRSVKCVLITNTTDPLGRELKRQLESHGCTVSSLTGEATSGAGKVDAVVIIGEELRENGLEGLSDLVSKDVYDNLKLLDSISSRVRRGGYMVWASAGARDGAFRGAVDAFDATLRASLEHVAKSCFCEPVWIGRCESATEAVERIIAALVPCTTQPVARFSIRNAAYKITGYVGRWLKIVT